MNRIDELESSIIIDEEILANMQDLGNIDYEKFTKLSNDISKNKEELRNLYAI